MATGVNRFDAMDSQERIEALNHLLRGELSAIAAYEQVLARFHGEPVTPIFAEIRADHLDSAARLRQWIRQGAGVPADRPGNAGLFASDLAARQLLFGERSVLNSLLEGEELGQAGCEDVLDLLDGDWPEANVIRDTLLRRQQRHVSTLRGLAARR